ncbi:MAG: iron-containing redox enzyme family protein [Gaiellales bacterium]
MSSRLLRAKIELAFPAAAAAAGGLWEAPDIAERYPEYLATLHEIVRATIPEMEAARARAEDISAGDPVACGVALYLDRHVPEEAGHADWLLEDLAVLGVPRELVWARIPHGDVASLVGAQYYWIHHAHPVALLGHMAVMEGFPPDPGWIDDLRARTGHPPEAFRFLRRHAALDPQHRDELFRTIDELPLSADHESLIGLSALHSIGQLARIFTRLQSFGGVRLDVQLDAGMLD